MSNFQGKEGGSPAECHGARITDLRAAFVVDGCAMVFRREALSQALEVAGDFPPHHFYDRLLSLVMYELGWRTAVLGIACDHLSGQTANTQGGWVDTAMDWCRQQGLPADGDWDHAVYLAAERSFLRRLHAIMGAYRLIRVSADFTIRLL